MDDTNETKSPPITNQTVMEKADQAELAKKLQSKLLRYFDELLTKGQMSPTDAATLGRMLMQNGWNFDETTLPQGLRSKLTKNVDLKLLLEDSA